MILASSASMISPAQWIQGVEGVWLAWLASLAVVLTTIGRALATGEPRWIELARGEEGVSYTLSYVIVFPVYLLFVCVVFETTWLLVAKVGTMYAAHAGARSAIVWNSAAAVNSPTTQTNRINQAVWTAMTPFVTGGPQVVLTSDVEASRQSGDYVKAYQKYFSSGDANANAPVATLTNQYLTAASRTTCTINIDKSAPDGNLTATVTYRAPLHIPGAGAS